MSIYSKMSSNFEAKLKANGSSDLFAECIEALRATGADEKILSVLSDEWKRISGMVNADGKTHRQYTKMLDALVTVESVLKGLDIKIPRLNYVTKMVSNILDTDSKRNQEQI